MQRHNQAARPIEEKNKAMLNLINQLIADQRYGTLAILVLLASATGYLLGLILNLANAYYYARKSRKNKRHRNR